MTCYYAAAPLSAFGGKTTTTTTTTTNMGASEAPGRRRACSCCMGLSTTDPFFLLGLRFACPRWGPAPTTPRLAGGAASPSGGPKRFFLCPLDEKKLCSRRRKTFSRRRKTLAPTQIGDKHGGKTQQIRLLSVDDAVPSRHFGDKQKKSIRECNSRITTPFSVCNKAASFVSCVCASTRRKPLRRGNGFS